MTHLTEITTPPGATFVTPIGPQACAGELDQVTAVRCERVDLWLQLLVMGYAPVG